MVQFRFPENIVQIKSIQVLKAQTMGMTKQGAQDALAGKKVGGVDAVKLNSMKQSAANFSKQGPGEMNFGKSAAPPPLAAKAYTQGNQVAFSKSNSNALQGHELAHVLQQGATKFGK